MNVLEPTAEFSPLIDLLYSADQAEQEQFRDLRDLLAPDLTATLETFLVPRSLDFGKASLDALLNDIALTAAQLRVERNLTDWPFQHFWVNPYETRHSKLLRFFLRPAKEHGGSFLLQRFLDVLVESDGGLAGHNFPADGCLVLDGVDYIDLLIKRESVDRRFAIIIENKINDAVHQDKQLTRYAEKLLVEFSASEIYVLYLPLHADKEPDPEDLKTLQTLGVHYRKITFETHILTWLNAVLLDNLRNKVPLGMRENLSHYRNLLRYLVNQRKTQCMNEQILRKLAAAQTLPTLSEVEKLEAAVQALKQCLESVENGKFLLDIQAAIKHRSTAEFYLEKIPARKLSINSPFDANFADSINLCVPVNEAVLVCFGTHITYAKDSWLGYVKAPGSTPEAQAQWQPIVDAEAKARWKRMSDPNGTYYRWGWNKDSFDGKGIPSERTAQGIADVLLEMREDFLARVGNSP